MRSPSTKAPCAQRRERRERAAAPRDSRATQPAGSPEEIRQELQEELLAQITHGGRLCAEVERVLSQNPAPELETLIKLYRVLILKFSLEANVSPGLFQLVCNLMKPVMEWARLEEKRKERELAEQKYRDSVDTKKAIHAEGAALTPETLQQIERELKLF